MIQFILLQNRQGKTRLSKYYRTYTDDEKIKIEAEIHRIVTTRDQKFTNFVEVPGQWGMAGDGPKMRERAAGMGRDIGRGGVTRQSIRTSRPRRPDLPPLRAVQAVQADIPAIRGALLYAVR